MSRFSLVLALIVVWAAPNPLAASVFSYELASLPDVPKNPAEKAIRAIYPGPVQWVFGTPEPEESEFVGFLRRLRHFFSVEESNSRPVVTGAVDRSDETRSTNAMQRDWDAPLPVRVTRDVDHRDVLEIFLGVNLRYFLSHLFSAVIKINEDFLTDRQERERKGWRDVLFGGGAASSRTSYGNRSGYRADYRYRYSFLDSGLASGAGGGGFFPNHGNDTNKEFDDGNVLVEVKETVVEALTHPLLIVALLVTVLFSIVRNLYRQAARD